MANTAKKTFVSGIPAHEMPKVIRDCYSHSTWRVKAIGLFAMGQREIVVLKDQSGALRLPETKIRHTQSRMTEYWKSTPDIGRVTSVSYTGLSCYDIYPENPQNIQIEHTDPQFIGSLYFLFKGETQLPKIGCSVATYRPTDLIDTLKDNFRRHRYAPTLLAINAIEAYTALLSPSQN